ncbi:MAG: c-type cytochrome [Opitutaceae bacterium]|nr:c-type cytochrome [Opitutaceae bacterium]
MSRTVYHLALALACASVAAGEPVVIGHQRFHAGEAGVAGGRLLYNELGCANCHGGDTGLPARRGPDLTTVTTRQKADWLRAFIASPDQHRSGTSMPGLFAGRDAADAGAVVHYLGTLAPKSTGRARLIRHMNSESGKLLFHTIGCVACHAPRDDYVPAGGRPPAAGLASGTVVFPSLEEKYVLSSLGDFIRDPLKTRPDGRMPRIEMEEQDAIDIASYLLGLPGSDGEQAPKLDPFVPNREKAARGRDVVGALWCAGCHDLPAAERVQVTPIRDPAGGCLAEVPAAGVPNYVFNVSQRRALQSFLARRDETLPAEHRVALTMQALNCTACHERDGNGGPDAAHRDYISGDPNLGDTGRYLPPLTGVGRKLQPKWLEQAVKGAVRVRPYLNTRMPVYGGAVAELPALLARVDAGPEWPMPAGDVEAGRKLLGTHGGVSCITCHRWADRASLGIQGMDISNLAQRLQPRWLRDYLVNPAAYRPGTLMPSFWPDGKAANREVLGGDTDRQIASIVAFAREGRGVPEGFPSMTTREFELVPTERPIVLRTFLQDVGTHAILVGFPAGVHLAYDASEARPALVWKGRFFDAYGTWFSRFAPFEKPLGDALKWPAPAAPPGLRSFSGYRLDATGVPIFLFTVNGVPVEERFEPVPGGLRRSVRWNVERLRSIAVAHPEGVGAKEEEGSEGGKLSFVYTWQ